MQRWNLHKRIALATLLAVGNQPSRQIAGFMIATAFISMWVSNTATSIMMLPIGLSVIGLLIAGSEEKEGARFAVALLLGIAYSASVGGIATLIGTPPNALLAAFMRENYDVQIGFGQWMLLGLPLSIGMLVFIWWLLTRGGFRLAGATAVVCSKGNGRPRADVACRKMVAVVFVLAAAAWIFQPLLADYIDGVNDTSIAMAAAIALFLIPVDLHKRVFLMDWEQANKAPWGVLLLFGGGLSLAGVIGASGLAEWIASSLGAFDALPLLAMIALVVTVIIFLTEITSIPRLQRPSCHCSVRSPWPRGCPGNAGDSGRGRCQLRLHDAGRDTTQRHRIRHGTVADPGDDQGRLRAQPVRCAAGFPALLRPGRLDMGELTRTQKRKSPASSWAFLSTAGRGSGLDAGLVLAGTGIDLDRVADFTESGNLQLGTVLQAGGLHDLAGSVATYGRLGVGDFANDGGRQFDGDHLVVVEDRFADVGHAVFDEGHHAFQVVFSISYWLNSLSMKTYSGSAK